MNLGTPEQGREIRRRRRVFLTAFWVSGLVWFIGGELFRRYLGERAGTAFISFYWLVGVCVLLTSGLTCLSCPVCKHEFPRGSDGRHCANCDTKFEF